MCCLRRLLALAGHPPLLLVSSFRSKFLDIRLGRVVDVTDHGVEVFLPHLLHQTSVRNLEFVSQLFVGSRSEVDCFRFRLHVGDQPKEAAQILLVHVGREKRIQGFAPSLKQLLEPDFGQPAQERGAPMQLFLVAPVGVCCRFVFAAAAAATAAAPWRRRPRVCARDHHHRRNGTRRRFAMLLLVSPHGREETKRLTRLRALWTPGASERQHAWE